MSNFDRLGEFVDHLIDTPLPIQRFNSFYLTKQNGLELQHIVTTFMFANVVLNWKTTQVNRLLKNSKKHLIGKVTVQKLMTCHGFSVA